MNMMMILRMMIIVILIINDHIDFLKIDFDHYQMLEPTDSLPVTGAETAADHQRWYDHYYQYHQHADDAEDDDGADDDGDAHVCDVPSKETHL